MNSIQKVKDIRNWMEHDCKQPLVLWPKEQKLLTGKEMYLEGLEQKQCENNCNSVDIRPVHLYAFSDFKFSANGGWIYRDGEKFLSQNIMPAFSDLTTEDQVIRDKFSTVPAEDLKAAFILTHNPCETYGHFMLEMAPKLIVYRLLAEAVPGLPILLSWYTPKYVMEWINFLAPQAPIMRIPQSKYVHVHRSYYCDMLVDGYSAGSAFQCFLDTSLQQALVEPHDELPEKIFISRKSRRSASSDFRIWDNEEELEHILLKMGFASLAPEALSLSVQIQSFRKASIVVGELSSALHNTIFSKPGTQIIQINPFNQVQKKLSLSLGHKITSILPDSGKLYGWPPKPQGENNFRVDVRKVLLAIS